MSITPAEAYQAENSSDSVPWQLFKGEQNVNVGIGPLCDDLQKMAAIS